METKRHLFGMAGGMRPRHSVNLILALCAFGAAATLPAKETRVLWCLDNGARAIHRFNVANVGEEGETWTETEPLATFTENKTILDVIPAHGGYYVCFNDGQVHRYTKNGQYVRSIGQLPNATAFEISADQAFVYGSDMSLKKGQNKISRLALGKPGSAAVIVITNNISQVRCMTWGADGLLYVCSRANGAGFDYWGNAIAANVNRGMQAFDVSNGNGAVLKHFYKKNNTGGGTVDSFRNRVYLFDANAAYVFGRSESRTDGETTHFFRAFLNNTKVALNNAFSGKIIAGHAYVADWHNDNTASRVYRFNDDDTATLVTNLSKSTYSSNTLNQPHSIREDVFPENDTTEAIAKLDDYWSFNAATSPADLTQAFSSLCNPKRTAKLTHGFTAAVRGAVREGLWCDAGAYGTLASAIIVPQTNDMSIAFFIGFPQAPTTEQLLLQNPKMTVSVTADGRLAATLADGQDIDGIQATGTSVTGTTSLADGAWHHVAVVRRAHRLEIWVDGVQEAESTASTVAVYDNINTQWSFLAASNTHAMFIDELRVYGAALAQNDLTHLASLATGPLVAPRNPTCVSHARAHAIGTVVAHAEKDTHVWGVPAIVADPDGTTLYLTADYGRDRGENNQSVFWKSTDAGASWTRIGSDASLGAIALFRMAGAPSGTFYAAGIEPDNNIAWTAETTDGLRAWKNGLKQSDTPVISKWYPTCAAEGFPWGLATTNGIYVINPTASGKGSLKSLTSAIRPNDIFLQSMRPGGIVNNGTCPAAFYAMGVSKHTSATNAYPIETAAIGHHEENFTVTSYRGSVLMRGASRPFGVIRDASSGTYWAVTTYAKDVDEPWTQANRLALYCSTDATDWTWCGDIAEAGTPETVGFNHPNLAIAGNDLVVVFGASVDDTTAQDAAPRAVNVSNYILSKRIANFRSRQPEKKTTGRYVLLGDVSAQRIIRLREDEETGEWKNDGYFANGKYTDARYALDDSDDIKYDHGKVWILKSGRLFAFTPEGVFTGTFFDFNNDQQTVPVLPDAMGFSYDGRYVYSTKGLVKGGANADVRYVYRTDTTTGETSRFCTSADSDILNARLANLRAIVGLPDGRVLFANRNEKRLFTLKADGTFDADIYSSNREEYQAFHLDRRANKVYASGFTSDLLCWNLNANTFVRKSGVPKIMGLTGDNRGRVFGTSYSEPAGLCDMLADNGVFATAGHRTIYIGGLSMGRCCFFDTTPPNGTLLLFR